MVDQVGNIIALIALIVSLATAFWSKKLRDEQVRFETVERQYDIFDELAMIRLEHPLQNHLFELAENYDETLELISSAIADRSQADQYSLLLKEKAVAQVIFNLFERTFYKHQHARRISDRERSKFLREVLSYICEGLMCNPRLQFYWRADGAGMSKFYEREVVEYYAKCVRRNLKIDRHGPFRVGVQLNEVGNL